VQVQETTKEGRQRAAAEEGQRLMQSIERRLKRSKALRRASDDRARVLGRAKPLTAAYTLPKTSCAAGDAGLCRPETRPSIDEFICTKAPGEGEGVSART